jgi:hypothetical protein
MRGRAIRHRLLCCCHGTETQKSIQQDRACIQPHICTCGAAGVASAEGPSSRLKRLKLTVLVV